MKTTRTLAALVALVASLAAQAQSFPTKPIKFIVPFTAGSGTDIIARTVGDVMSKNLGQPVIIENKPGAGGTIAAAQVAKGDVDGYTILIHSSGHAVNPAIYPNLPYDTVKDFSGITTLASLPNVLVVAPARGWKTQKDLVAAAKAKPGGLNYGSAGTGSATHINAEKFRMQAGIDAVHVPYKGTPEAMTDIIGGRLDWFFAPLASALPLIKDGKMQALAVSTPQRSAALPDVPTTVEAGVPGSDYVFWVGMFVPSRTPPDVVARLNAEAVKALNSPEVKERMSKLGADPYPMSPAEFDNFVKTEVVAVGKVAKAANLQGQ
jgi:tripartite-type tricarboxylate transporter receptor subunit TctC